LRIKIIDFAVRKDRHVIVFQASRIALAGSPVESGRMFNLAQFKPIFKAFGSSVAEHEGNRAVRFK
jgi:hypothetical protein